MNNVLEKNQKNIQNGVSNMIHAEQQSFIGCEVFEEKALPIKVDLIVILILVCKEASLINIELVKWGLL